MEEEDAGEEVIKMRIAIATDDRNHISQHFGRAQGFMVFEISGSSIISEEYRANIGKNTGQCGSCNHGTMIKNIRDCDAVISYGMGQGIYSDLLSHNIQAIVTEESTVKDALRKFMSHELRNRIDKLH